MDKNRLIKLLESIAEGRVSAEDGADQLQNFAYENIEFAHIDHHRSLRKGFPEVIFGEGKTADQITGILEKMTEQENIILVTRTDRQKALLPAHVIDPDELNPVPVEGRGLILVISAGTSDIPVAREAYLTAKAMGNAVESIFDVGVSGIHRLFNYKSLIHRASVLIVVVTPAVYGSPRPVSLTRCSPDS